MGATDDVVKEADGGERRDIGKGATCVEKIRHAECATEN